jgi:hypothetical protein
MGTKSLRAGSLLSATGMSMRDENLLGEMEYGGFFAISMGLLSVSFPFFWSLLPA